MTMEEKTLFHNARYCKDCGTILLDSYTRDLCSNCEAQRIFDEVRDYIRSQDVNEYDVAKHFDIPVGMVQQWIKEGRIQYKERGEKTIMNAFCQRCGAKVTFWYALPEVLKGNERPAQGLRRKGGQHRGRKRKAAFLRECNRKIRKEIRKEIKKDRLREKSASDPFLGEEFFMRSFCRSRPLQSP